MSTKNKTQTTKIVFVFALSAFLIAVSGVIYYYLQLSISKTDVHNQIISVGKLKTNEIENWRTERLDDAEAIIRNPIFIDAYTNFLNKINTENNQKILSANTEALKHYNQYENMLLIDGNNSIINSSKNVGNLLSANTHKIITAAREKNEIMMSDFYMNESDKSIKIDIAAPIVNQNKYLGCLLLIVDANNKLYSMVQTWPYDTETAENLLFTVENNEVVYLNELRFSKNTALKLRMQNSKENKDILAVQSANGKFGLLEGVDYQGNEVIGYSSKIGNTNWILITKIQTSEAFASANKKSFYTILLMLLISITIAGTFYWFWKDKQAQTYKILEQNVIQAHYTRSLIEASLDPFVTISPEGKITDVNEATIKITGISRKKLIGADFSNYFTEPQKAKAGYLKVFEEGYVIDYPLTLMHENGKKTDVLYNASVYKDLTGKVVGIFAAARDVTEIQKAKKIESLQVWLKSGLADLNVAMKGDLGLNDFAANVISEIAKYLDAKIGAFYVYSNSYQDAKYVLKGSYAYTINKNIPSVFNPGEGLVGQAALEKRQIVLKKIPEDYIKITSGLGEAIPRYIYLTPVIFENTVTGVIELGMLEELSEIQTQYLSEASRIISLSMETVISREELDKELKRSQNLAEELKKQQEELKASNEELEEQTQLLKLSEEKLKAQQEELRVSNEELESRNDSLEIQKREIENARNDIKIKAEELALASKYKSEFLANMSHELRTPLNSLLILSKMLYDNKEGNLNKEQVESANIIYNSGNDLLHLINEILDLSKIEAGRMDIHVEPVYIKELAEHIKNNFKHIAEEKGIKLEVETDNDLPESIMSDMKRIEQILKNLISNAIKFTKDGGVIIKFKKTATDVRFGKAELNSLNSICISVNDTGIGISLDKQKIIFEAFQQEEGGTSREYGGTGLGLSISKELASLLGGEIHLESKKGVGSTFTLYLPIKAERKNISRNIPAEIKEAKRQSKNTENVESKVIVNDDRNDVSNNEKSILIIEDNVVFANLLLKECKNKGFNGIIALSGEEGLKLAKQYKPAAIMLDILLPGMDGLQVLDSLKDNSQLRHIPVHIMSVEDATLDAMKRGAIGFLSKPPRKEELDKAINTLIKYTNNNLKNLLVAEDDDNMRNSIVKLIGNGDVKTTAVRSGKEVIAELERNNFDCMIMDLGLADITGFELLKLLESRKVKIPPTIVYTGRELTRDEETLLRNYADSIIIKGVRSEERLLDEASLFLHRIVEKLPSKKRKMIIDLYETDEMFKDKKILIVDDDMRNMFALSKVLSQKGFHLYKAENGLKALELLKKESDVDLILMDIMMPEMDGYETIMRIRSKEKYFNTPIFTLTAKAMRKDYERCIAVGASDYLPKPVDLDRLFSMLRVWLYR